MKRLVVLTAVAALGISGAAVATADPSVGKNIHGLCTAYFAGSENGQANKRKAPPFKALEAAAERADQTVAEYCAANDPKFKGEDGPGGGGGNGRGTGGAG